MSDTNAIDGEIISPEREERAVIRDADGRWLKGHSANPGGQIKAKRDILAMAREASPAAMRRLISIIEDDRQPVAAHLAAAQQVLDRAWGKPKQDIEVANQGRTLEDILRAIAEAKEAEKAASEEQSERQPITS